MPKPQPETRIRKCRACGREYEYPLKGDPSTRHHCAVCATLPEPTRAIFERLTLEIRALQRRVKSLETSPKASPEAGGKSSSGGGLR
jgi:hypothetical protein